MANNAQKVPYQRAMNQFAERKILDAIQQTGKALPARVEAVTGSIVRVSFQVTSAYTLPQVTVPLQMFEYARAPIQVGCLGQVQAADARLGGVTGLGGGVASLNAPANLSALSFVPLSNTGWSTAADVNKYLIYGPNGFEARDTANTFSIIGDKNAGTLTMKFGNNASITIKDGEIDITATTIKLNGIVWGTHEHTGVTAGTAKTGGPTAP